MSFDSILDLPWVTAKPRRGRKPGTRKVGAQGLTRRERADIEPCDVKLVTMIPQSLSDALDRQAQTEGTSKADIVRRALTRYLR